MPASWRHLVPGLFVVANAALLLSALAALAVGSSSVAGALIGIWALQAAVYGSAVVAASFLSARKHGWRLFPVLPMVFATYHVSYGAGFLVGLAYWQKRGTGGKRDRAFSEITR
jgi:small-conductance mechanosensitive channel